MNETVRFGIGGDFMLWQKSWRETRWTFLMVLLVVSLLIAGQDLWRQPDLIGSASCLPWRPAAQFAQQDDPRWGERKQYLALLRSGSGCVWWYWSSLQFIWPWYAIAMTATLINFLGPLTGAQGAAARFTFSLPVSRRKALLTDAAVVAIEMILVALVASLIYPIAIRLTGRWFPFKGMVIYALLLALGGMIFIAFAFLLMVIFNNKWIVMAIGIPAAFAIIPITGFLRIWFNPLDELPWWHIYHVMSGETYFRYGRIPWLALLASLAVSAALMFAAVRIYERRDF
ncbi:MAG: ABC-2 transporter permease [Blastocatellia bacterium]